MDLSKFGKKLKKEILNQGYKSLESYAYQNKLTKSTVTRLVNGEIENPHIQTVIDVLRPLNKKIDQMIDY